MRYSNSINLETEVKLGPHRIPQVTDTKFLGVYLDDRLKWNIHIAHVAKKISKICGILYAVRNKLTDVSIRMIYFALIYSQIIYCIPLWGNAYSCHLRPIVLAQKRAVRTMTYSARYEHTLPIFNRLNLLKFDLLYKYFSSLLIHKFMHQNYVQSIFSRRQNQYHGRNSNNVAQFRTNLTLCIKCVFYSAPSIWNSLDRSLKQIVNVNTFKLHMKAHLFQEQSLLNH